MEVLLVRHAIALNKEKARLRKISDPKRPLTRTGKKLFAKHVARNEKIFKYVELYVDSVFLRSQQTLDILLHEIETSSVKRLTLKNITSGDNPQFLLRWLLRRAESKIVIVSHEPFMTLFLDLTLGEKWKSAKISKGAVIRIRYTRQNWKFKKLIQSS